MQEAALREALKKAEKDREEYLALRHGPDGGRPLNISRVFDPRTGTFRQAPQSASCSAALVHFCAALPPCCTSCACGGRCSACPSLRTSRLVHACVGQSLVSAAVVACLQRRAAADHRQLCRAADRARRSRCHPLAAARAVLLALRAAQTPERAERGRAVRGAAGRDEPHPQVAVRGRSQLG